VKELSNLKRETAPEVEVDRDLEEVVTQGHRKDLQEVKRTKRKLDFEMKN
jgi:hypothetical protein